ncbi:MAG: carbohydrate ABC transporter substrate-binding protein [Proteobacteria bacterium]|nr:carbohydrate ABC transporter substrate-binding protein [Pseudomonadota bacterium]
MKKGLVFSALLLLLLSGGCTNEEQPTIEKRTDFTEAPAHPDSEKRVNWMGHWLHEHDRETIVQEVAQDFELMNPDIDVNLKYPQQIMGVRSKYVAAKYIVRMIKTGNIEWDVIWLDDRIYQHVAEELDDPQWGKKHLVNFEEVDGFTQTQKPFIIKDSIYREQTGGMIVGPYIEGYYNVIYYNKDVAKQIGIKIKHAGMTYDDLLSYVVAVDQYNQEHNTNIAAFYECNDFLSSQILFQNLFKSQLSDFDKAKKEVGSDEKNAALLKTFQAFEELGKYNPLIDSHNGNVWFKTLYLPLSDKCLFFINGIWMYSHWMGIDEEKTIKMIPAELPVFQKTNYYLGGYIPTWAVMKDAPNRDEGIRLLMFWSTPLVAEKWVRYAKAPTGLVGHLSTSDTANDQFEQFQAKITNRYGSNVHYSTNAGYIFGERNRLLQNDLDKIIIQLLDSEITAQQAYDEIVEKVK